MPFLVSYDTETYLIEPGNLAPKMVCSSHQKENGQPYLNLKAEGLDSLEFYLGCKEAVIVGANIAYDFGVAIRERPSLMPLIWAKYDAGKVFDTHIAEALSDIGDGTAFLDVETRKVFDRYSLGLCVKRYLGLDISAEKTDPNAWRLRYSELDGVPLAQWPEEAKSYALHDAVYTLQVAQAQIKRASPNLRLMPEEARAAWALHLSAIWGMRTDSKAVAALESSLQTQHTQSMAVLQKAGYVRPDGSKDTKAIKAAVERVYQGHAPRTAPSDRFPRGQTQTSREVLLESGDPVLTVLGESSNTEKILSTYLPVLKMGTERPLTSSPNVLVRTGRTSYGGFIGPDGKRTGCSPQTFPRKGGVRECFVPREGYVFAACDYSTLELCTLAQVTYWYEGQSHMREAINAGKDLHLHFASEILHQPYEALLAAYKAGDAKAKDFRQMAKAANFGFPGGLGPAKFVRYARDSYQAELCVLAGRAQKCRVTLTQDEFSGDVVCAECLDVSRELRAHWFAAWPEVQAYHERIKSVVGDSSAAIQVPKDGLIRGDCGFCDGSNMGFQGLAARGAKKALAAVSKACYLQPDSPLWGARPIVFVHDEILAEVFAAQAHEQAKEMERVMIGNMQEVVPDVKISAEVVLMPRWYKGAKQSKDASGRLIPWTPKKEVA